jgi:hypothetical protein
MKLRALSLSIALVAGASSAQAATVAGFDFSQYIVGFLSTDGGNTLVNTLPSNYSDLDNTLFPGLGIGSTQYGTMYLNGQFGSYNTPADGFNDPLVPSVPDVNAQAVPLGVFPGPMGSAAALQILLTESPTPSQGQTNANSLQALDPQGIIQPGELIDVVFQADLGTLSGSGWQIGFGGQMLGPQGGSSNVIVEFSEDGSLYQQIGVAVLTPAATPFLFNAPGSAQNLDEAFFRLRFTPDFFGAPSVDNVQLLAEVVPEPGTIVLTMAGLAGLAAMGRRRDA